MSYLPVKLELRCRQPAPQVGDMIDVDVVAVCPSGNQPLQAAQWICAYDPVELHHVDVQAPVGSNYALAQYGGFQGINTDLQDGLFAWTFGGPLPKAENDVSGLPVATPAGVVLATMRFTCQAAGTAMISLPDSSGPINLTRIFPYAGIGVTSGKVRPVPPLAAVTVTVV